METRLFPEGTIPEYTTDAWYAERESAPHVDQDAHRPRLDVAAQFVVQAYEPGMIVVDLGSGDGGLLWLISAQVPPHLRWGYDLQQSNVDAAAARGQNVMYGNVLTDDISYGDICVTTEMLEHLIDPHAYVRHLSSKVKYLVASSPAFETADAHYEYHTWAWDKDGYAEMLVNNGFSVVRHDIVGPFQVVLAISTHLDV
jgi:2-polyprenyl-3-methyl-5-hydroxy-6-metoxy-1,4-benzoquinol methylase